MKIGVDLDGVLASFESQFAPLLSSISRISFPLHDPEFPPVWDWPQEYGCSPEEIAAAWNSVKRDPGFWLRLTPYPKTPAVLKRLQKLAVTGHDVYFITTRVGVECKRQSELWLQKEGFMLPTVIISASKGQVADGIGLNVFIDDKPENIEDVIFGTIHGARCYLLNRPYNLDRQVRDCTRVNSVEEMLDLEGL